MKEGGRGMLSGDNTSTDTSSPRAMSVGSANFITDLELAFAQNPSSSVYIELCEAYVERRRYMEAMVVCKKAIRNLPDDVQPRLLLCKVYVSQEKYNRAFSELDSIVESFPNSAEVASFRGKLYLKTGDEAQGIEELKRAVDLDNGSEEAINTLLEHGIQYPPPVPDVTEVPTLALDGGLPSVDGMATIADVSIGNQQDTDAEEMQTIVPESPAGSSLSSIDSQATLPPPSTGAFAVHPTASGPSAPAMAAAGVAARNVSRARSVVSPPDASGVYKLTPQVLEGEDELEKLANQFANEKPSLGRPRVTVVLSGVLAVLSLVVVSYFWIQSNRTAAIHKLFQEANTNFNRDLYGSYKLAASSLEEILESYEPEHPKVHARLAHIYTILYTEHLEQSVESRLRDVLSKAQKLAPDDSDTVSSVALMYLNSGSDRASLAKGAAESLKAHVSKEGEPPRLADLTLGIVELEMGTVDPAMKRLRRVADSHGRNVRARMWFARAAARSDRTITAQQAFKHVRNAEPKHPGALAGLALVSVAQGKLVEAKAAVDAFVALESGGSRDSSPRDRALAKLARSELLRNENKIAEADVEYESAVRLDSQNADIPYLRGRALLRNDRLADAVRYLSKAVELEPTRWTFRVELAEAMMSARQFDDAKKHIEYALKREPNRLQTLLAQARFLRRIKSPEAEKFLKEDLSQRFPRAKAEIGLELGRLYRSQKRLVEAEEQLLKTIESSESKPEYFQADVFVSYGLVVQTLQLRDKAARAYRAAVTRGNLDALALLAALLEKGSARERAEALDAAQRYLRAGSSLRRTEFVKKVIRRLRKS